MRPTSIIYLAGLLGILLSSCSVAVFGNSNLDSPTTFRSGKEFLDDEENYEVTWNTTSEVITFQVRAKTLGYVALGFSASAGMAGADIFIGGVFDNGTKYSSDRHATGHTKPIEDKVSNYELMLAQETKLDNQTIITFQRPLNTCDDEDYQITHESINVIWAMGETDDIERHNRSRRGSKPLKFFDETVQVKAACDDNSGKEFLHSTNIFTVLIVSILSILAKTI